MLSLLTFARIASDSVVISLREMNPLAERADYTPAASVAVPLTAHARYYNPPFPRTLSLRSLLQLPAAAAYRRPIAASRTTIRSMSHGGRTEVS